MEGEAAYSEMLHTDIAVVGAGASGLVAAIRAASDGAKACLIESGSRVGRKILKTGNGKCNLSHLNIIGDEYRGSGAGRAASFLERFGTKDTIDFFKSIGLLIRERDGYLYPYSEQASAVLDVLRFKVSELDIELITDAKVTDIKREDEGYKLSLHGSLNKPATNGVTHDSASDEDESYIYASKVILCAGGAASPETGSDGYGYRLAERLGLKVHHPLPALVKVRVNDPHKLCPMLAGVRAKGTAYLTYEDGTDMDVVACDSGEIQFTSDGLSGIPIFNISRYIVAAIEADGHAYVRIDTVPDMSEGELVEFIVGSLDRDRKYAYVPTRNIENNHDIMDKADMGKLSLNDLLAGIVNKKITAYALKSLGIDMNKSAASVTDSDIKRYASFIKNMSFGISSVYGFEYAQVTCGGVDFAEVDDNLECAKYNGLYLAGEILDIDGPCGGYNLQWAWTSGYIAGMAAVSELKRMLIHETDGQ